MSSISEISSQVADLSLADKLSLIESVVASIRKEGGMPAIKKTKKGEKATSDGTPKPKRKAALGTLAWTAYVKHIKTTQPEAFEGLTKESEKLVIVKGIRAEDAEGYKSFTEAWKAAAAEASDASEAETTSVAEESVAEEVEPEVVVPKKVVKAAPKIEKPKVTVVVRAEPKAKAEKAEKAEKPKVEKVESKAAEKPAKVVAKVVKPVKTAAAKKAEVPPMPQKEIDGTPYWHDPSTNGLWEVTGPTVEDGTGSWIGYYQPGNEEEPIRFTENFGDE